MSTPATLLHSANANQGTLLPATLDAPSAWKLELNARLREHRERKGDTRSRTEEDPQPPATPLSRVAERVAARYSAAPSYQELLSASASAAAAAADSAVEAHAAAQAALREWESGEPSGIAANDRADSSSVFDDPFFAGDPCHEEAAHSFAPGILFETVEAESFPGFDPGARVPTIEHHEPLPVRAALPTRAPVVERALTLVDAFAEAVVPAAQGLPAKLIEFPRELIAPRKQRPRLAEGPLFEQESSNVALRIFEVGGEVGGEVDGEPERPSRRDAPQTDSMSWGEPAPVPYHVDGNGGENAMARERGSNDDEDERAMPRRRGTFHFGTETAKQAPQQQSGWGAIRLGEHPQSQAEPEPESVKKEARRPEHGYAGETVPALHELAPIGDRMMAALVDAGVVFGCFLLSVLVFTSCTVHPPAGKGALAIGFLVLGVLGAFYGWLFMTHGGGSTPGMRYARIALCTFADENPSRKDFQNRIPATALALLPLGLGLFWALLDEDKLGWHDRMTRTYQRSYR